MNSRKSLYDKQEFYRKGAILKASFQGMRYQVEKWQKDNEEECFRAAIWPEPFCFEKTPEENKTYAYFPYTEEGLDDVYGLALHPIRREERPLGPGRGICHDLSKNMKSSQNMT